MLQVFSGSIEQKNGKGLIVQQVSEQFADAAEKLVGVENSAKLTTDSVEQVQSFGLRFGSFLGVAQFLFALDAFGEVAKEGAEKITTIAVDGTTDGDFDGNS
jgi:hypothetical protein